MKGFQFLTLGISVMLAIASVPVQAQTTPNRHPLHLPPKLSHRIPRPPTLRLPTLFLTRSPAPCSPAPCSPARPARPDNRFPA